VHFCNIPRYGILKYGFGASRKTGSFLLPENQSDERGIRNMEETIRQIIMQADDERNLDLICWVKEILDEFASAPNCPPDWRRIGAKLAGEYPADSWVYENLELYSFSM